LLVEIIKTRIDEKQTLASRLLAKMVEKAKYYKNQGGFIVKKIIFASVLPALLIFSSFVFAQQNKMEVQTVSLVDLKRYAGKWFEIARYPGKFQKNCVGNTTVIYTQKTDGQMDASSQCVKKNGTIENTKFEAKIADKTTNAKFDAQNAGDFWIIDLDSDYKYVVLGDPKRENFWILSREPEMKDALYQDILRRAEKMGFNPGKVVKTPQNVEILKGSVVQKQ
jgi:apolipoprotein D and lipocalin family protein